MKKNDMLFLITEREKKTPSSWNPPINQSINPVFCQFANNILITLFVWPHYQYHSAAPHIHHAGHMRAKLAPGSGAQMDGLILASGIRIIYLPLLIADTQQRNEWWIPAFKIVLIKLFWSVAEAIRVTKDDHSRPPSSGWQVFEPHTSIMDIKHIQEEDVDIYMCASLSRGIYCGLHFAKNSTYLTAILFCLSCEVKGHRCKCSYETKDFWFLIEFAF